MADTLLDNESKVITSPDGVSSRSPLKVSSKTAQSERNQRRPKAEVPIQAGGQQGREAAADTASSSKESKEELSILTPEAQKVLALFKQLEKEWRKEADPSSSNAQLAPVQNSVVARCEAEIIKIIGQPPAGQSALLFLAEKHHLLLDLNFYRNAAKTAFQPMAAYEVGKLEGVDQRSIDRLLGGFCREASLPLPDMSKIKCFDLRDVVAGQVLEGIEDIPQGLCVKVPVIGNVAFVNERDIKLLGYSREAVIANELAPLILSQVIPNVVGANPTLDLAPLNLRYIDGNSTFRVGQIMEMLSDYASLSVGEPILSIYERAYQLTPDNYRLTAVVAKNSLAKVLIDPKLPTAEQQKIDKFIWSSLLSGEMQAAMKMEPREGMIRPTLHKGFADAFRAILPNLLFAEQELKEKGLGR